MRSLLEIIASGSISSLQDLDFFIRNTLKYTLCNNEVCVNCMRNAEFNKELFGEKAQKRVYDKFEQYLNMFSIEQFRQDILDDNCQGCIYEFTKQVIAYLKKFNFLIFEQTD
jgi:hypothetical protein